MKTWSLVLVSTLALALAGCGKKKGSAADRALCEKAADRWVACLREIVGDEMAEMAESKRDIDACAADAKTVEMYETCLPEPTCEALMACIDRAVSAGP